MNVTHDQGEPALAGPVYQGEPALAGPVYQGEPALAGPVYQGEPALAGPVYQGEPAPAGPVFVVPEPGRVARLIIRMNDRSPRWAAPAAIALCFAGAASYVWISNPTDTGAADVTTCIVKLTTGLDCPGCGGTRAFYYLMHGNVPEAARHHVMAVFAAPFLIWLYLAWTLNFVWGKKLPMPKVTAKTISIFLAAWAVFMVARNLPFAPFTSLYV